MLKFLLCFIVLIPSLLNAQGAKVSGRVFNSLNNAPLAFATIKIINEQIGAVSAEDGTFEIADLSPGVYSFKATPTGFGAFGISIAFFIFGQQIILGFILLQRNDKKTYENIVGRLLRFFHL